jgi:hypothetical protein
MGSLNLSLGGAGKGISAEVTFINGLETIREHSFTFSRCIADRFKNKSKNDAMVLKEIKEMKIGCTFRTIVLVGMRFLKK